MEGTRAFEQLQGSWIIEVGELSAMKKAEVELVKNFITKTEDSFRPAYGRVTKNFPRQCVFIGTTNSDEFLKDATGGRRFLPVRCKANPNTHLIFEPSFDDFVDQLWAEAVQMYYSKVSTLLSPEAEILAEAEREEHYEIDPRTAAIQKYVDMYVPLEWDKMNQTERKMYYANYDEDEVDKEKCMLMDFVSAPAVLIEALDYEIGKVKPTDSRDVNRVLCRIQGWERGVRRCKAHGQQRGYARKVNSEV